MLGVDANTNLMATGFSSWDPGGLESLTKRQIDLLQRFGDPYPSLTLSSDNGEIGVKALRTLKEASDWLYFEIWIGEAPVDIYLSHDLVETWLFHLGYRQSLEDLPGSVLRIVAQHVFGGSLEEIEAACSEKVAYLDAEFCFSAPPKCAISFDAFYTEKAIGKFSISASIEILETLLDAFLKRASQEEILENTEKTLTVSLQSEAVDLGIDEFNAICVGDGLLLPESWEGDLISYAVCEDQYRFPVARRDGKLVATGSIENITEENNLKDHQDDEEGSPSAQISVEIARHKTSLKELNDIRNGQVLSFDVELSDEVQLIWLGKPLARAKLLQVDGHFAAQITEVY